MSYNGTVRCSWCYQTGHNKRSCPEYTEILKQRAIAEIENGEGYDGYWGRQYNKRVRKEGLYADGTAMPAEAMQTTKQVRRCTYCGAKGHNRRTCPQLVSDKSSYVENTLAFRKRLVAAMRVNGFGVGSLLKTERWGEAHCWLVTQIHWEKVDERRVLNNDLIVGKNVRTVDRWNQQQGMKFPLLTDEEGTLNEDRHGMSVLAGPVEVRGVPADFLEEQALEPLMADLFDADAKSENYWTNYHDC